MRRGGGRWRQTTASGRGMRCLTRHKAIILGNGDRLHQCLLVFRLLDSHGERTARCPRPCILRGGLESVNACLRGQGPLRQTAKHRLRGKISPQLDDARDYC